MRHVCHGNDVEPRQCICNINLTHQQIQKEISKNVTTYQGDLWRNPTVLINPSQDLQFRKARAKRKKEAQL